MAGFSFSITAMLDILKQSKLIYDINKLPDSHEDWLDVMLFRYYVENNMLDINNFIIWLNFKPFRYGFIYNFMNIMKNEHKAIIGENMLKYLNKNLADMFNIIKKQKH